MQAYPKGRKHLVIFEDVDVFLPVEREVGENRAAIPYIIRRANHVVPGDSSRDSHIPGQPLQPGSGMPAAFRFMMSTPWPLPRLFIRFIRAVGRRDPTRPGDCGGHGRCDRAGHGRSRRWLVWRRPGNQCC